MIPDSTKNKLNGLKSLKTSFLPLEIEELPMSPSNIPLKDTKWRWTALVIINAMVIGSFMTLEGPQPIETQIKQKLGIGESQYSMLYTFWAFPSIITPFFGGYLIDKFGIRPTTIAFGLAVTIGQFIYAYGGYSLNFSWMLFGRVVYAFGTDPLNVAQIFFTNKWFEGKELGLAMSITGAMFGIGRGLNSFISPILYDISGSITVPMMFGAFMCALGLILMFYLVKIDEEDDKRVQMMDPHHNMNHKEAEQVNLMDMKFFKPIVWMLIMNFAVIHAYTLCFNAFANDFYHVRYGFTNVEAGMIISLCFVFFAVSGIICGKIIDSKGKRATIMLYNSVLGVFCFIYFFMSPTSNKGMSTIIPQILLGAQQGNAEAAIYTSLPLTLQEKYLGTGFGLFFVFENVFVLIMPIMAAYIKESGASETSDGYFGMLVYFFIWSLVVVVIGVQLYYQDKKTGSVLDDTITSEEDEKQKLNVPLKHKVESE